MTRSRRKATTGRVLTFVVGGVDLKPMLAWIERRSDDVGERMFWMAFYVDLVLVSDPRLAPSETDPNDSLPPVRR